MTANGMFGEDFPEVRAYIRAQLREASFGAPHTKRELGTAAVRELTVKLTEDASVFPTVRDLATRGAIAIAAEELRRLRVRFKSLPAISAFYAIVVPGPDGKRVYLQAPVPGMTKKQVHRVWRRMSRQQERSGEVAGVFEALLALETWGQAETVAEACRLAGDPIQVYAEEPPETSTG